MPILAQDLVSGQVLVTVKLSHTVKYAQELMIENGYNQLPIVDEYKKPLGIITARVIAQAIFQYGINIQQEPISSIGYTIAHIFPHTEDVLGLLETLNDPSIVLFSDATSGELSSVVTSKDTSIFFRQKSEELIHLRFIDKSLREHIDHVFTSEASNFNSTPFEGLIRVVESDYERFKSGFSFPLELWSKMMDGTNQIRDKVLNLKDEISSTEKRNLRGCAEWYAKRNIASRTDLLIDIFA